MIPLYDRHRGEPSGERSQDSIFRKNKAKTGRLICSDCGKRIKVGESVVFELSPNILNMRAAYCANHGKNYFDDNDEIISESGKCLEDEIMGMN